MKRSKKKLDAYFPKFGQHYCAGASEVRSAEHERLLFYHLGSHHHASGDPTPYVRAETRAAPKLGAWRNLSPASGGFAKKCSRICESE